MSEIAVQIALWTGGIVWLSFGLAALGALWLFLRHAINAARFTARVMALGPLTKNGKKSYVVLPLRVWWDNVLHGGFDYMTRVDGKGGRIYWPGKEPRASLSKHKELE